MTDSSPADRYAWRTSSDYRDEETRSDALARTRAAERVGADLPDEDDGSDLPWGAVGVVVFVLVTGAFASGWHFGRRWGRLMGW